MLWMRSHPFVVGISLRAKSKVKVQTVLTLVGIQVWILRAAPPIEQRHQVHFASVIIRHLLCLGKWFHRNGVLTHFLKNINK